MKNRNKENPLISLVLPVYNEAASIKDCMTAINSSLNGLNLEIIFVDGSTDGTLKILRKIVEKDNRVKIIKFSRNFGKEAALTAGLEHCIGDATIPVDVDLQDPIETIHEFVAKWRKGYDIVHGVRRDRSEDSLFKRLTANRYYQVFNFLSETKMTPHSGDFRLLDRKVVNALKKLPERVRFMKGLFSWVGFSATEIYYSRMKRASGNSKFSLKKLLKFGLDGLISFSSLPLRVWSIIGVLIAIPALIFMLFIVIKTLVFGVDVPGYASIVTIILFIGGIQLITRYYWRVY